MRGTQILDRHEQEDDDADGERDQKADLRAAHAA